MDAEARLIRTMGIELQPRHIRANGYDLNYVVVGDGPPLILIHGVNIGWGEWHLNIPDLARHFRVYALDLPGAGHSTSIDFLSSDLEKSFVDTVEAFIRLHDLHGAVLVGHSSGGWIALKLALRKNASIRSLILVNSLGFSDYLVWRQRPLAVRSLVRFLAHYVVLPTKANMEKFLKSVFVKTIGLTSEFMEYYSETVCGRIDAHPLMLIHRFLQPFRIRKEFVIGDRLRDISIPTLIIASNRDPLNSLAATAPSFSYLPHATIDIFKGSGHVPPIEDAARFNKSVISWIFSIT